MLLRDTLLYLIFVPDFHKYIFSDKYNKYKLPSFNGRYPESETGKVYKITFKNLAPASTEYL